MMTQPRILVVEDDPLVAAMLERRLQIMAYRVVAVVGSGEEAIAAAAKYAPDLVLMDIQLPGDLDGIEAAAAIQQQADLPVIYLTGNQDEATVLRAKMTQPFGYLVKPAAEADLRNAIEIALQKHAYETLLRAREARFRSIIQDQTDLICRYTQDGALTFVNEAFYRYFGIASEQACLHRHVFAFIAPAERAAFQQQLAALTPAAPVCEIECEVLIPPAARRWQAWKNRLILNEQGEFEEYQSTGRDITERKHAEAARRELEAQLRQSQKLEALGILAGGIAHDFNNLLGTMLGYTELLQGLHAASELTLQYLGQITRAGERAAELIQHILTFSRSQKQQMQVIALEPTLTEALLMLRASLPTTIAIRPAFALDCPSIMGNATQIQQVLVNLCTNASHAMRNGGGLIEIQVAACDVPAAHHFGADLPPGRYACLRVRDTGCGMPPEVQEHVFEPFFTTKAVNEGTGLGLSVVYGIVKEHHGAITITSAPGQGTTVEALFPAVAAQTHAPAAPVAPPLKHGRARVLVVEDEADLADLYTLALAEFGYQVTTRANGQEALECFRAEPTQFDLVFTDQTMPLLTGAQLSQELLRVRPELPIILSTGYHENLTEAEALQLGIRKYLLKPVKISALVQTIQALLPPDSDRRMA